VNYTPAPGFTSGGVNWQVSTRYEIPLPSTARFTESISGGFDFKRSDNSLAFGILTLGPDTIYDIDQFVLSYQATYLDDFGSTFGSASLYLSPGGITNYNTNTAFAPFGAQAEYAYEQYALTRITKLPFDFSWKTRGLVQVSNGNLAPTEQLGMGGYDTVRGYEEREANGDHGFLFSNEIDTPPISIAALFGNTKLKDQLQFLAFVDYGGVGAYQLNPANGYANTGSNLLGVGPGLRYNIAPYVAVRFDYGFQLINTNLGNGEHSRANVGVVVSF